MFNLKSMTIYSLKKSNIIYIKDFALTDGKRYSIPRVAVVILPPKVQQFQFVDISTNDICQNRKCKVHIYL